MNIEVANRLVNLRKEKGLSQEQLAEKIGVSRQAVSKWERSEASPDTDNLILLARLYNISLDELLKTEDDIPSYKEEINEEAQQTESFDSENSCEAEEESSCGAEEENSCDEQEKVNISWKGIHVKDAEDEVHVGWDGIHVKEKHGDTVHIDRNGIFVNGEQKHFGDCGHIYCDENENPHMSAKLVLLTTFPFSLLVLGAYLLTGFHFGDWSVNWLLFLLIPLFDGIVACIASKKINKFPYPIACVIGYLCSGFFAGLWHPMWIIFLTIPLFSGFFSALKHRSLHRFPYPVLTVVVFLAVGCVWGLWHPTWVVFITIPIYYWLADIVKKIRKHR